MIDMYMKDHECTVIQIYMLSGQHLRCHTDVSGDKMRCGVRLKLNKDNGILIGMMNCR